MFIFINTPRITKDQRVSICFEYARVILLVRLYRRRWNLSILWSNCDERRPCNRSSGFYAEVMRIYKLIDIKNVNTTVPPQFPSAISTFPYLTILLLWFLKPFSKRCYSATHVHFFALFTNN